MVLTYTLNIPDAPNNPSNDQPNMKTNTNSISDIIDVDHYTFDKTPSGKHRQVTLAGKNVAGVQADPASTIYSDSGIANTVAELRYRNQSGIFPLSLIRAYGIIQNGAIVGSQSINVSAVAAPVGSSTTVTLTSNAVTGTSYGVLALSTVSTAVTYTILSSTQFRISGAGPANTVTFVVFQL